MSLESLSTDCNYNDDAGTNAGEDAVDTLDAFIGTATAARAASAQRLERQGRALTYSLSGAISTSEVFAMAEQAREACTVEEYGESFTRYIEPSAAKQQHVLKQLRVCVPVPALS